MVIEKLYEWYTEEDLKRMFLNREVDGEEMMELIRQMEEKRNYKASTHNKFYYSFRSGDSLSEGDRQGEIQNTRDGL